MPKETKGGIRKCLPVRDDSVEHDLQVGKLPYNNQMTTGHITRTRPMASKTIDEQNTGPVRRRNNSRDPLEVGMHGC